MVENILAWLSIAVGFGAILALSGLGETINEKVGHLNLGVPGIMYFSAICAYVCCMFYEKDNEHPIAIVTILIALLVSFAVGMLFGLIYSVVCVTFKCNQNVMGLAIASFGVGFGKFLSLSLGLRDYKLSFAGSVFNQGIPVLKDIPYVGRVLFNHGFMTYVALVFCIIAYIFFKRTRAGLNLSAVGESPATADAAGIRVTLYKYVATLIGCGFCGLGGMTYVLDYTHGLWSTNNNIEAIGWLDVCLVIFVTWRPIHLIWGAPLFAFCYWAYTYIPVMVSSKFNFVGFNDLLQMLPYLVTIIILIINSLKKKKENQPPQSLGVAYFRENR